MVDILKKASGEGLCLTFDDVLLAPGYSEVVPSSVDLSSEFGGGISLKIPLVSADMDTVTGVEMARKMALLGGLGFLWKSNMDEQVHAVAEVKHTLSKRIDRPITIGLNETKRDVLAVLNSFSNRFSSLVVVDENNKVVGLVTGDRIRLADEDELVKDFMVKDVIFGDSELDVKGAYDLMKQKRVPKLILINESGILSGMYCFGDLREIIEGNRESYNVDAKGRLRVGANVGVNDIERAEKLLENGCDALLVGTAHGHSENVLKTVRIISKFKDRFDFCLVAGNVATYAGAKALFEAGADVVKVGIGPGSICTTRVISGVGVPQVSAVYDASRAAKECGGRIIADGGIRYSGDIVKALAAGAFCVMMGSAFAGTKEAPGDLIDIGGQKFKSYRGMGSLAAMKENSSSLERYSQANGKAVAEGVEGMVPYKGSVEDVIFQFIGGVRSGMGYVGAKNLLELKDATFNQVTNAGQVEAKPHNLHNMKEALNFKL